MTDKKTGVRTREAQTTTTKKLELTPLEEKVVRMHHGLAAPAHHELEMAVGPENTEMVAKLQELERRVLAFQDHCAKALERYVERFV